MRETRLRRVLALSATALLGAGVLAGGLAAGCSDEPAAEPSPADAGTTALADAAAETSSAPDAGGCEADLASDGLARHLSCAGLYADVAQKTLAAGVRPYTPAAQFWSDGSTKTRFITLPPGTTIDATNMDDWKLPVGTKLWKELALDGKRIETRVYAKTGDATWKHTSYRWNATETEADRLDKGELVPTTSGIDYEIPAANQCLSCHKGKTEPIVGFDAVSLGLPGAEGLTLATLVAENLLSPVPATTSFTIPDDGTGKAAPAIAWLHANCGGCHQKSDKAEGFFTQTFFRLTAAQLGPGGATSATELDALTTTCDINSGKTTPDGGLPLKRIAPGSPEGSSVWVLSHNRTAPGGFPNPNEQMPPLISHVVDEPGTALLAAWITALPGCP